MVFDELAERYDSWYDRHKDLFEKEIRTIPEKRGFALEVGVGSGRFAERLGIDVGIDISWRMLKIAKRRGVEVVMGDAGKLPFRSNSFNRVYLIFTLCFLENPEAAIEEAKRVAEELVVCVIPADSGLGERYQSKDSPFYRIARFYSMKEVEEMLEKHFEIVEVRKSDLGLSDNDFVCYLCRRLKTGDNF